VVCVLFLIFDCLWLIVEAMGEQKVQVHLTC